MDVNLEVESRIKVWLRRLLWTVHYNLIALGLVTVYGFYRVHFAGDQFTYTTLEELQESEAVGEAKPTKQGKQKQTSNGSENNERG